MHNLPPPPSGAGQVCIPNISLQERRKRLAGGVVQLVFALVILAGLIVYDAPWWWRAPLLLVFWGAASAYFQWRDQT